MQELRNSLKLSICAACLAFAAISVSAQSRNSLFDDDDAPPAGQSSSQASSKASAAPTGSGLRFSGSLGFDLARAIDEPDHWMHKRLRWSPNLQGGSGGLKWKLGVRLDADAAYVGHGDRYYNAAVRDDQRTGIELRENYLDTSVGSWELRLGKQHVVWGEMVGTFVADVVSPRDLRDFVSTDLDKVRRTTWAARFEKFSGDWHSELLWVPVQTYDKIGKPGADFYPYPAPATPGYAYVINPERQPRNDFDNGSFGARTGFLKNGWDASMFYYVSRDVQQTFERSIIPVPVPVTIYTPVHDRIRQLGGTVSKDAFGLVWKGEAVVTSGRRYTVTRLDDDDGLVPSRSIDVALGADYTPVSDLKLNFQLLQRSLTRHDDSMLVDKNERIGSILATWTLNNAWETELLWASSLNRSEGWISPSVTWKLSPATRLRFGADFFYGPATGVFGRYDREDRIAGELRYSY